MCASDHDVPPGEGCRLEQPDLELRRLVDSLAACASRGQLMAELQNALAEVRRLSGLLVICAGCKKIRDDEGQWHPIEFYLQERFGLRFTHTMCPDCVQRLYPDVCKAVLDDSRDRPEVKPPG
jgi:hypothetical protein